MAPRSGQHDAGLSEGAELLRNPKVTLLCYGPRQPLRSLEVRGTVVGLTEEHAGAHLDALASTYSRRPVRYFGDIIPSEWAATEVPVLWRIRPTRVVTLDATGRGT